MLKLIVKPYVDKYFDGNINRFAFALGTNYNPAKGLYLGETTRLQFSTLTELCRIFHCTPNDLFVEAGPNGEEPYMSVEEAFCNKKKDDDIPIVDAVVESDITEGEITESDIDKFLQYLHSMKKATEENRKTLQELPPKVTSSSK